jgi:hypothetical protein
MIIDTFKVAIIQFAGLQKVVLNFVKTSLSSIEYLSPCLSRVIKTCCAHNVSLKPKLMKNIQALRYRATLR